MTVAEPDPAPEAVAGEEHQGPTPARQWAVFLTSVLLVGALIALVLFAIELPTCEDPPNSWAPCIGP
ncbi:hypothetical protein ABDK96_08310 [Citricoccus nitrophenolicus]|uniref:Uncharacterized protein n=1 Tax=Citricoccus nitrophenolicus TaxID=863575 RepID=A0ABV0IHN4_9MICC